MVKEVLLMNYSILILSLLVGYVMYSVFTLVSRTKHDNEYIDCYQSVFNHKDGSYEKVNSYVEKEQKKDFLNKGLILKLYSELDNEKEYNETLEKINLRDVFSVNGKFSRKQMINNTDVFICLYLAMAKARQLSKFDVLNSLCEKINSIPEFENYVEYQLAKAIYNSLCEKEDGGTKFMSDLLEGNYSDYGYDKKLIGLYKRFAAATLAYNGELVDEYYLDDLHSFADSGIGENYLKSLEIYEKYKPSEDSKEETA